MTVRFSHHAIQRLGQRFPGVIDRLVEIVERGLFEKGAEQVPGCGWKVEGLIDGRPARVVFVECATGDFIIVTVMWIH